jgi:RHH-type proline utilization regulon transcriptional repressor/proline dehydrogenase/delta 1-pyrroline-5-carboxylate dehydrogenase
LQAYLRDTEKDLESWIEWAKRRGQPVTVRLVKGAYWDQETIKAIQHDWQNPVFAHKSSTDANFEALTRRLLENHEYLYAAIGSHNVRSQAHAIAIARELKIPARRIELQVLYGMADKLAKALVNEGFRVRVYCPYGELIPGMAYLIRRLLENTANTSFLRQNLEERPVEELLAAPEMESPWAFSETIPQDEFKHSADTDFSITEERDRAFAAIRSVREQLGKTYLPLVNGERMNTLNYVNSVNPSNPEEVVGQVGLISVEQAEQAIQAAKVAFRSWKKTPAKERADILRRAANLMEQRREELCAWMVLETGKPLNQADPEVSEAIDFCNYYAEEMERLERGHHYDVAGETDRYHYQPRGISVVISPWNFPLAIPVGMTVASLVTGNLLCDCCQNHGNFGGCGHSERGLPVCARKRFNGWGTHGKAS